MNILVSIFFLLIANNSNIVMENHMATAFKSADLALSGIQDAERNGAEISPLIEKFNTALGLIEQANTSKYATCFGYDNCLDSATTIFNSISKDSVILKDEANRLSDYKGEEGEIASVVKLSEIRKIILSKTFIISYVTLFITITIGYWLTTHERPDERFLSLSTLGKNGTTGDYYPSNNNNTNIVLPGQKVSWHIYV
jgi:hypothetical protein